MGEVGLSPCPEECRGPRGIERSFCNRADGFVPFRHGAIRADRAEVPRQSARLLSFLGHFREISMKVPGTGLPDLEGGRRGWVCPDAHFT